MFMQSNNFIRSASSAYVAQGHRSRATSVAAHTQFTALCRSEFNNCLSCEKCSEVKLVRKEWAWFPQSQMSSVHRHTITKLSHLHIKFAFRKQKWSWRISWVDLPMAIRILLYHATLKNHFSQQPATHSYWCFRGTMSFSQHLLFSSRTCVLSDVVHYRSDVSILLDVPRGSLVWMAVGATADRWRGPWRELCPRGSCPLWSFTARRPRWWRLWLQGLMMAQPEPPVSCFLSFSSPCS